MTPMPSDPRAGVRRALLLAGATIAAAGAVLAWPAASGPAAAAPRRSIAQQPVTATDTAPPPTATDAPTATPTDRPTPRPTATRGPFPTPFPTFGPRPSATPPPTETSTPRADIHRAQLVIESMKVDPKRPSPGNSFGFEVDVQNVGRLKAYNVRFSWQSETFLPEGESTQHYKGGIDPDKERDFDAKARVAATVKAGMYPIQVTVTWEDASGVLDTVQATLAVEVGGQSAVRPLLAVTAWRAPSWVVPGNAFGVAFDVVNTGGRTARNVQFVPAGGSTALASQSEGNPLDVGAGGRATQTVRLIAAAESGQRAVAQPIELRYDDEDGVRYTENLTIGFGVVDPNTDQPLPMIDSYRVRPVTADPARAGDGDTTTLHPGEVFWLDMSILNVGRQAAVRAFLAFGGGSAPSAADGAGSPSGAPSLGVFAPLGRSNRLFLGLIRAGEGTTVTQRMVADGAAKPGVYALDVAMSYDNAEGKTLQSSEVVTLLLSRQALVQFSPVNVVTSTVTGQSVPFAVEIINTGANTLNVGDVRVEGSRHMGVQGGSRYVGPLDDGGSDVVEAVLEPKAPGAATVTVVVTYVDDFNQSQEIRQDYAFEVAEAPAEPEGPATAPPPTRGFFVRFLRGLFGLGASPGSAAPTLGPTDGATDGPTDGSSSGPAPSGAVRMAPAPPAEPVQVKPAK